MNLEQAKKLVAYQPQYFEMLPSKLIFRPIGGLSGFAVFFDGFETPFYAGSMLWWMQRTMSDRLKSLEEPVRLGISINQAMGEFLSLRAFRQAHPSDLTPDYILETYLGWQRVRQEPKE